MEISDLMSLWGGTAKTNLPLFSGASWEGLIFFKPTLDFQYYKQGAPSVVMLANRFTLKKVASSSASDYDDGMDFSDEDEDTDDDVVTPMKKAKKLDAGLDDEYEIDYI